MKDDLDNQYFVESLKKRLSLKGLTGVELSKLIVGGETLCTEQHLSRILNFKQTAGKKFRNKFSKWLGLSVHDMITEGADLVSSETLLVNGMSTKRVRRSTDIALSDLSLEELTASVSHYASEVHQKYMDIAMELQKRLKAENDVRIELKLFRQSFDQAPAAVKILRVPDKVVVYRNKAEMKLEGKDFLGEVCGVDCVLNANILDKVVGSRDPVTEIIESKTAEVLSVLAWPIYDPLGELVYVGIVARNITNRYHEAGVAETSAKRYESVLRKIARYVYIYDESKRLVYTNATRPGGILENASKEDLQTIQSVTFYVRKLVPLDEWQIAVGVIQEAFDEKKSGTYQANLFGEGVLSSEVHPIIDGDEFRGVVILSRIIES